MTFRFESRMEGRKQSSIRDIILRRTCRAALFIWVAAALAVAQAEGADAPADVAKPVTIPFEVRRGHVMVPTMLNGTNRISMMLDTGYGMTMLRERLATTMELRPTGRSITIVGIAGDERAKIYDGPEFGFGSLSWQPRRIAALPADSGGDARRRDGILGSGFFRRYVVEIDPFARNLHLHDPDDFAHKGGGDTLPLAFKGTTPLVTAQVKLPNGRNVEATFEIDTGCDSALCVGRHFVEQHGLDESAGSSAQRSGVGGRASVRESHLGQLRLGGLVVKRPAANLFLDRDPADPPVAGHIGWDLLKQFRVTFDYSRKRMILSRQ